MRMNPLWVKREIRRESWGGSSPPEDAEGKRETRDAETIERCLPVLKREVSRRSCLGHRKEEKENVNGRGKGAGGELLKKKKEEEKIEGRPARGTEGPLLKLP